jgi:hypothetical protein
MNTRGHQSKKLQALTIALGLIGASVGSDAATLRPSASTHWRPAPVQTVTPAILFKNVEHRAPTAMAAPLAEHTLRRTFAQVDLAGIRNAGQPEGAESLWLELFPDVAIQAQRLRIEDRAEDSYTWVGNVEDDPDSTTVLTVVDGQLAGYVNHLGAVYRIKGGPSGLYEITEVDADATHDAEVKDFVEHGELPTPKHRFTRHELRAPWGTDPRDALVPLYDDGSVIDIMVLYTDDVAQREDMQDNIGAEIQLAIDITNQSFVNSGIDLQLRLVHTEEVDYEEGFLDNWRVDGVKDLQFLEDGDDGILDQVHALRDEHRADVVSLWRNQVSYCNFEEDYCRFIAGIANIMDEVSPAFAERAFHVVDVDNAVSTLSFAHELGHNLGARHDRYVDPTEDSPFGYNHGLVDFINGQRSIMAYSRQCYDNGYDCPRIPYWSSETFGGYIWSDMQTKNDLTITQTAYTVANFRNRAYLKRLSTTSSGIRGVNPAAAR